MLPLARLILCKIVATYWSSQSQLAASSQQMQCDMYRGAVELVCRLAWYLLALDSYQLV